jgi:hypothetical protein
LLTGRPYVEIGLVPQPTPGPKVLRRETNVGGTRGYLPVLYIIIIIVKMNYFKNIYNINPMYVAVG